MMILEPKRHTGKKPLVYYSVRGWSNSENFADTCDYYEFASEAIRRARNLVEDLGFSAANVREEVVYRRTKDCEISSSAPLVAF